MNIVLQKFNLQGKTAFVTGGGTGMGYYMARGLAGLGAEVIIASRRESVLKEAAERMSDEVGNKVHYLTIDLLDRENVETQAQQAIQKLNGVDIFVGNAGQEVFEKIEDIRDESMDRLFQANVFSNFALSRAFLPSMRKKQWGRIIFSSSIAARLVSAQEGLSLYGSSKTAIFGLVRSIAMEAGHDGVTANSLVLGTFLTDMIKGIVARSKTEEERLALIDSLASNSAVGRFGRLEEVEGIVQLLASDGGAFITGAEIPVEGGWTIALKANPVADDVLKQFS